MTTGEPYICVICGTSMDEPCPWWHEAVFENLCRACGSADLEYVDRLIGDPDDFEITVADSVCRACGHRGDAWEDMRNWRPGDPHCTGCCGEVRRWVAKANGKGRVLGGHDALRPRGFPMARRRDLLGRPLGGGSSHGLASS